MKSVLVTGGAGYIGSHTVVELLQTGYDVVVYDNLSNSSPVSLERVAEITGKQVTLIQGDIRDSNKLNRIFEHHDFDGVIHFAGLKAVGESVEQPIRYYNNNVFGSLQLLEVMANHNVKKVVFSSSATVYGNSIKLPFHERMPVGIPSSPYGMSKLMVENILADVYKADRSWQIVCLRYFNPVGAHPSGLIGEDPQGVLSNLMPFIMQTALGKRDFLSVFGGDYSTSDGSAVRDYVHVVDLAKGHIAALKKCGGLSDFLTINIGSGKGFSVLEVIKTFERVNNLKIPFRIVNKRVGDVAVQYADTKLAKNFLGWQANLGLDEMCRDSWNWQIKNYDGYSGLSK